MNYRCTTSIPREKRRSFFRGNHYQMKTASYKSPLYYTRFNHSEKVVHCSFLIYSLAQSDHTMKPCEMLQRATVKTWNPRQPTTATIKRQTPTESGFEFGFMLREADLLWFLIIHKKQKSQCIDWLSSHLQSVQKSQSSPPIRPLVPPTFWKQRKKVETNKKSEKEHRTELSNFKSLLKIYQADF